MAAAMKDWSVALDLATEPGTVQPEQALDLIEALEAHHAGAVSVSSDGARIGLNLWVQAADPKKALAAAERAVLDALERLGLAGFRLVAAEIKAWQQLEEELRQPNRPELVGVAELADVLRVSKQRISELAATEQFPRPLAHLKAGPVWDKASVGNFLESWRRTPGRPPKVPGALQRDRAGKR